MAARRRTIALQPPARRTVMLVALAAAGLGAPGPARAQLGVAVQEPGGGVACQALPEANCLSQTDACDPGELCWVTHTGSTTACAPADAPFCVRDGSDDFACPQRASPPPAEPTAANPVFVEGVNGLRACAPFGMPLCRSPQTSRVFQTCFVDPNQTRLVGWSYGDCDRDGIENRNDPDPCRPETAGYADANGECQTAANCFATSTCTEMGYGCRRRRTAYGLSAFCFPIGESVISCCHGTSRCSGGESGGTNIPECDADGAIPGRCSTDCGDEADTRCCLGCAYVAASGRVTYEQADCDGDGFRNGNDPNDCDSTAWGDAGPPPTPDSGVPVLDATVPPTDDAGPADAGTLDAGTLDAGTLDAGSSGGDAGRFDAGTLDAGTLDAGTLDAGSSVDDAGARAADAEVEPPGFDASSDELTFGGGGCACRASATSGQRSGPLGGVVLALMALLAARRRRGWAGLEAPGRR